MGAPGAGASGARTGWCSVMRQTYAGAMPDVHLPVPETAEPAKVHYVERLRPSPWLWVIAVAAGLFLGVAYGFALGPVAGLITFGVLVGIGGWLVIRLFAVVRVDERHLRAGRASLPVQYIGRVRALDSAATAAARGPGGDANAFLLLRNGYAKTSVAVEVTDPRDPHSYWLISSRRPEALASAIMSVTAGDQDH